jgi:hypothetical protein
VLAICQYNRRCFPDAAGQLHDTGDRLSSPSPMNVNVAPGGKVGVVVDYYQDDVRSFTTAGLVQVDVRHLSGGNGLSAAISPSGDRVYVRSIFNGAIDAFAFDPNTGALSAAPIFSITVSNATSSFFGIDPMAISPDGGLLYVSETGKLSVYSASTGALLATVTDPHISQPTGVAVSGGQPQLFAGNPQTPTGGAANLIQEQLQPVVSQAIALLATAGFNVSGLGQVDFRLVTLPESLLGMTYQKTIWIDQNAQGYGWYIDVSGSNVAFTRVAGTNEFRALPDSPANGHVDLLTVVTHELGHVLGFPSIDSGILGHDWMTATLGTGIRRYPDVVGGSGPNRAGVPAGDRVDTKSLTVEPLVPIIGPLSVVPSTSLFVLSPQADMPAGSSAGLSVAEVPMFSGLSFTPPMTDSAIPAAPSANLSRWRHQLPTAALDRLFADVDPSGLLTSENA